MSSLRFVVGAGSIPLRTYLDLDMHRDHVGISSCCLWTIVVCGCMDWRLWAGSCPNAPQRCFAELNACQLRGFQWLKRMLPFVMGEIRSKGIVVAL